MQPANTSTDSVISFRNILTHIVSDRLVHARFLNTLSFMEHVGATKIAKTQSGQEANFTSLKHAAEEARHAFYLKKLSLKLQPDACPNYNDAFLLAPIPSRQYLYRLDVAASRLAKNAGYSGRGLHDLAYLLVTYAIEVRADELYPVYEEFLDDMPDERLSVQSIIAEETGHLAEMETALASYPSEVRAMMDEICRMENNLFVAWLQALESNLQNILVTFPTQSGNFGSNSAN
jgi:hypothetical protein